MSDMIIRADAIAAIRTARNRMKTEEGGWPAFMTDAIRALPAYEVTVKPEWMTNCAVCGRVVDTREVSEGGDAHGCEYAAGWACSSECAEKLSPDPDWLTATPAADVAGLVKALGETLDAIEGYNRTLPDEDGLYWDRSDLITQEIMSARAALARIRSAMTATPVQDCREHSGDTDCSVTAYAAIARMKEEIK